MNAAADVTQLLQNWHDGDTAVPRQLMPIVYDELRRLAATYLALERANHTLQATALVHEAYLKLVDQRRVAWKSRAHFSGVAAQLMRRILVDYARARAAEKRGGDVEKVYLDETRDISERCRPDLVALDEALQQLAVTYPRESNVVELKFFGGLEAKEIAEVLRVSEKTVLRDWSFAKLWLWRELAQPRAYA